MRAAPVVLLVSSAAAAFAFSVFQGGGPEQGGSARHWASMPLLAFAILFAMGCLILLTAGGPRGRLAKFK